MMLQGFSWLSRLVKQYLNSSYNYLTDRAVEIHGYFIDEQYNIPNTIGLYSQYFK